ncbi:ProQ/FINO family protein [Escherichia coli]|nr:ProQ/FINO family protein [Escherichia coli]MCI3316905.1 ProQ/FINO family protein [Escherichia coli]MCI3415278.1 ProQ/FINO family protein [Escherichia coli]MCI3664778.1 ProQ/FINO family protein [Escherichia coli]MDZ9257716.1 ProQ/FINO family protein [Escherichia coli]
MAGGVRYDLKDHPCGKVTQEHLANAGKRLDEIKKKQQERRKSNRLIKRACLGFCVNAFSQK